MNHANLTARLALFVIVAAFVAGLLSFTIRKGEYPMRRADGHSEANSIIGARHFAQEGFSVTSGLPRYHDCVNLDSGSRIIGRTDIYTRYFPGPDYILALSYILFGDSSDVFRWTRLVPLTLLLLAAIAFLSAAERLIWRGAASVTPVVAFFLLFTPAMRPWVLSLHGHGYSSACILAALTLGLAANRTRRIGLLIAAAFGLGLISNYMLLTAAFAVCAAPLVGSLLAPASNMSHRRAVMLCAIVGLGLMAAFGLHFAQIVHQFGWRDAFLDQVGAAAARAGQDMSGASAIELFHQYQLEVGHFFGIDPFLMTALGWLAAWLHPGSARERRGLALAVLIAAAASWAWIFVMRGHSYAHGHVNPRIFLLLQSCVLSVIGALASARCRRVEPAPPDAAG